MGDGRVRLILGDCIEAMREMDEGSVDLILTDPPYFRVKTEAWDRQWGNDGEFLAWLDECAAEWERLLRPNGSLYVFASPRMAAQVEVRLAARFNVLNRIRWVKDAGWHKKAQKEALRSWLSPWEEIIFAEQYGSDGSVLRDSGYGAACATLHAGVFEPLRRYLVGERDAAGISNREVDAFLGTNGMAGHYFGASQWALPTEDVYEQLRVLFNRGERDDHLRREYEDLRREYEDLRREYEDLRRPFSASDEATDVWNFPTVKPYAGKHPCEKPISLLAHIVAASTRPGALVLDCFMGSGATGEAALSLGREFVGIERDPGYFASAQARLAQEVLAACA